MSAGHEDRDVDGPFDMTARDQVKLSQQERQSLAHLEARMRLEDPDFVTRMRGRSLRWIRHLYTSARFPDMPAWLGPVLLIVGLLATLLTVEALAWLSVVTVGITVIGAYRVAISVRAKVERSHAGSGDRPSNFPD